MKKQYENEKETPAVSEEVHEFLSANGKKGGRTTSHLIELGKKFAEESGEDVRAEAEEEIQPKSRRVA